MSVDTVATWTETHLCVPQSSSAWFARSFAPTGFPLALHLTVYLFTETPSEFLMNIVFSLTTVLSQSTVKFDPKIFLVLWWSWQET